MNRKTAANSLKTMRAAAQPDRPPASSEGRPIRYSLLLDRELHKEIRRYAFQQETDMSAVVRVLFELLREDSELGQRVAERLQARR